ncbi:hypothetical protein [Sinorhizobium meliloti]|nr:hypothetical protein [Sinorhizobium meliloti]
MIETAATDGEPPSNLTSPQIPHMNRVETSIVGTRRAVTAADRSAALTAL